MLRQTAMNDAVTRQQPEMLCVRACVKSYELNHKTVTLMMDVFHRLDSAETEIVDAYDVTRRVCVCVLVVTTVSRA